MFESLFSVTEAVQDFTLQQVLVNLVISIILGAMVSITYMKTNKQNGYSQGFVLTMILLPTIVSMIVFLIGNNIARAFTLAGAFSIIRFRSVAGEPKDIAFILFAMASGLACGVGSIGYGILFTIVLCALMLVLNFVQFGVSKTEQKTLKITIPENLAYEEAFDEVFKQFNVDYKIQRVKTTELGSLYEVMYVVSLDNVTNQKEFLDAIRVRNGNLDISLTMYAQPKANY